MLRTRVGVAAFVFAVLSVPYAYAGAARQDPKGESRPDPHEQRASLEKGRADLGDLKQTQRLLRQALQARLAQKAELAKKEAELAKKDAEQAAQKLAEAQAQPKTETGHSAAAATSQIQKPAPKIVKPKALAKAANGKNPHEVFASAEDREENQPADVNVVLLRDLETYLGHQPYYQSFANRTSERDPGSGLVDKLQSQDRREGTQGEEALAVQALARVGDQPEVGYFISHEPAQRKSALADTAYADTLANIKRWRRIAMLDPDAEVRAAANLRLDRAGQTLAAKYLRALHPTERRLVGRLDPYDPATREFLEQLVAAPTGSQVQSGLTPNLQNVAARLLEEFPQGRPWREDVEHSLAAQKLPAVQAEMLPERAAELNEVAKAKQAALDPQLNILYVPTASLEARLAALGDTSVENSPENWQSWIYVGRHDSDPTVQALAWRRAAEASPAYEFTQKTSPLVQLLLADVDPHTVDGYRRLLAIARREWDFSDRLPQGVKTDWSEGPVVRSVARELLKAYVPRATTFEARARLRILTYGHDVTLPTLEAFDALALHDAVHAEAELRALLERLPKSRTERTTSDQEILAIARMVLETVVHPAQPGTLRAIVARYLSDESMSIRYLVDPVIEQMWDAADRIEELADLVTQFKSQFLFRSDTYNFFESLSKDLETRAHGAEDPDRATPEDLAQAKVVETEFVAKPISRIGYDPKDSWAERLAAVKANEVTVDDYNDGDGYKRWLGIAFSDENMFVRAEARRKVHAVEADVIELWLNEFFASHSNYDEHEAAELVKPLLEAATPEISEPTFLNLREPAVNEALRAYATRLEAQEATRDFGVGLHDLLNHVRAYGY